MDGRHYISIARGFASPNYDPISIVFAKGYRAWLWDVDGNKYLDCLCAYGATNHGHCHPELLKVLTEQGRRLGVVSGVVWNDRLLRFLQVVSDLTGFEMALLLTTGTEAVEAAIKLMRLWGHRRRGIPRNTAKIVVCEGNYHGMSITITGFSTMLSVRHDCGPHILGFEIVPYNDLDAVERALDDRTCGILVEPIQCQNGIYIPDFGYRQGLRKLATATNTLLCLDEIQTGLGRTGNVLCCSHENVKPDILTLGKSLGGGLIPVSAVLSTREVMGAFQKGDHGGTFANNTLGAAVATRAIELLMEERLVENAVVQGEYLKRELQSSLASVSYVREVRGKGLLIAVELDIPAQTVCERLWQLGVFCKPTQEKNIRIAPALVVSRDDCDFLLNRMRDAFLDV